jgi:hypothetical protein
MTISITKYVDITSGAGGGAVATTRSLVGRLFTDNNLLPVNTFISFSSASAVGDYFGTTSEEYKRAVFYFSWVSKTINQPQSIQFARVVLTAVAPRLYSVKNNTQNVTISAWTSISTGSFGLTIGSDVNTFSGLDFTGAADFAAVAAIIQTAIHTKTGTMWTSATVTYNATTGSFDFVGGSAVDAVITVQAGATGVDISGAGLLGWIPQAVNSNGNLTPSTGAIWADGSAVQTITEALTASSEASNNFGSFLFLTNLSLTLTEAVEAATWNQTQNVLYMYTVGVASADISDWTDVNTGLGGIGGVAITLSDTADEYPEQMPMMIEAATDYNATNSVQNYMYQVFAGITPSVTDDSTSDALDALSVNYYGTTQTAGQFLSFYQRGLLQGASSPTNITDMTSYVNEIWLKDAAGVAIINLLLSLPQIPANTQGRSQILAILQDVINLALNNGTISVGKDLTTAQQSFITNETGDNKAWYQVQNNGYWVDVQIIPIPNTSPVQYEAVYLLVYSKDDVIRKVVGTQTLI